MGAGAHLPEGEQPGNGPKKARLTALIIDTQRVKNAALAPRAMVGFDAGKLVTARMLTDTLSNVLARRVVPAALAGTFWDEVTAAHNWLDQGQVVFVDGSFTKVFRENLAHRYGIRVEKPVHVLVEKTNFCLHAWR